MPPQDRTPLGDAMTHRFPQQKIPQPKPGANERGRGSHRIADDSREAGVERPSELPDEAPSDEQGG